MYNGSKKIKKKIVVLFLELLLIYIGMKFNIEKINFILRDWGSYVYIV